MKEITYVNLPNVGRHISILISDLNSSKKNKNKPERQRTNSEVCIVDRGGHLKLDLGLGSPNENKY